MLTKKSVRWQSELIMLSLNYPVVGHVKGSNFEPAKLNTQLN